MNNSITPISAQNIKFGSRIPNKKVVRLIDPFTAKTPIAGFDANSKVIDHMSGNVVRNAISALQKNKAVVAINGNLARVSSQSKKMSADTLGYFKELLKNVASDTGKAGEKARGIINQKLAQRATLAR